MTNDFTIQHLELVQQVHGTTQL